MNIEKGIILEYRIQRLFLGQGVFAERSLYPAIGQGYDKQATDIDILATTYETAFHASRTNVESKSGKHVSKLDRILWLAGVKALIQADSSYLVAIDIEQDVADFGKKLDILTFSEIQIDHWEKSIGLDSDCWLGRSNYFIYETAADAWAKVQKDERGKDPDWNLFKDIHRFLKYDSWLHFSYSNLNRLIRLATMLASRINSGQLDSRKKLCAKYNLAALLVRFNQLLVGVCEDSLTITTTRLEAYLTDKLTYGESGSGTGAIVEKTIDWIARSLKSQGLELPDAVKSARVTNAPSYTSEFVSLTQQLLKHPLETSYLPFASELTLFGDPINENWPEQLKQQFNKGKNVSALSKGFFLRLLGLQGTALDGLVKELSKEFAPDAIGKTKPKTISPLSNLPVVGQLALTPHNGEHLDDEEGLKSVELTQEEEKAKSCRLEVAVLDDGARYLKLLDGSKTMTAEALYSETKYEKFLVENNLQHGDKIILSLDSYQKLKSYIGEVLSDKKKLDISADWVEKYLKAEAKETGFQIKGNPDWNFKMATDAHDFTIKVDGTNRTFSISTASLLDIATNQKARTAFAKKMNNELFARGSKPVV